MCITERKALLVTRPDWRTSYWPANVNTRMSTPLVSLHHGVQISLPIQALPPVTPRLAAAVSIPTPASSFTHSPLVRSVSHLLPTPTATAFPSFPLYSTPEPSEDYYTIHSGGSPLYYTNNTPHACEFHFSALLRGEKEREKEIAHSL